VTTKDRGNQSSSCQYQLSEPSCRYQGRGHSPPRELKFRKICNSFSHKSVFLRLSRYISDLCEGIAPVNVEIGGAALLALSR
jgi:hypothetical protein